jgi:branched-chain amino acid transport system ATP-binding protein
MSMLVVNNLTKRFGGFTALDSINISIGSGERIGLIGPNGSGKSTLVNCISGAYPVSAGTVHFDGNNITHLPPHQRTRLGIGRTFQIPKPFESMSALQNVCIPLEYAARDDYRGQAVQDRAHQILTDLELESKSDVHPESLTQIDLRKLELARAIAIKPKLLIADEVMAGLAGAEIDEVLGLLQRLGQYGITIIMIEHIMHAVIEFSERMIVLNAGKVIADGAPDDVINDAVVEQVYLGE